MTIGAKTKKTLQCSGRGTARTTLIIQGSTETDMERLIGSNI